MRATGSCNQTGRGAIIAATWLPSAPRASCGRTLTGTMAFSSMPAVSTPPRGGGGAGGPGCRGGGERAGDGVDHHVFEVAAEPGLDHLHVPELHPHPGEAPVRADALVVRGLRR